MRRGVFAIGLFAAIWLALACHEQGQRVSPARPAGFDADRPQVAALGNLVCGRAPTDAETRLAEFLFGAAPAGPLLAVKPVGLRIAGDRILIADMARRTVLEWNRSESALRGAPFQPPPGGPVALSDAPDDGVLVTDGAGGRVLLFDSAGRLKRTFARDQDFRPVDALWIGAEVWVTNSAAHAIDIFDSASGAYSRSLGKRGDGRGEFGLPLGMARGLNETIYVVDMLNARVQAFDSGGRWLRQLGGPGARVGAFGRPKDVAVGPDGTVFVSDAATQRIHAFDADGVPLLAFGSPEDGPEGLWLPNSIAISATAVPTGRAVPTGLTPSYYVLVTEQMFNAGVRVFAWQAPDGGGAVRTAERARERSGGVAKVANPHWSPTGCRTCHAGPTPGAIAATEVNELCLSCHDGVKAVADPHPIAIAARTPRVQTPSDWPTVEDRLGCLTCHDIVRHCSVGAVRPAENSGLVRNYDATQPLDFCANCHNPADVQRLNPHQNGSVDGCRVCHLEPGALPRDGQRRGSAGLNDPSSRGCLRCHTEHWDYAPTGHLGKPLRPQHAARQEAIGEAWPLQDGVVACYTCHNPHGAVVFPPGTPLAARARGRADAELLLRADQMELCRSCHAP